MFGLGIGELAIIVIIIIIFVKPEDLPKFFRKVGRLYAELKKYNDDLLGKFRTFDQQIKKSLSIDIPGKEQHTASPEAENPPADQNNKSIEETKYHIQEGEKP
jgi:Sec-independent protein translocase protein TatA